MKKQIENQQQTKTKMHLHYHYYNFESPISKESFREKPLSQSVTPIIIKNQVQSQIQGHNQMYNFSNQSNTEQRQKILSKNCLNYLLQKHSKNRLMFSQITEPISEYQNTEQIFSNLAKINQNSNKNQVNQSIKTKDSQKQQNLINCYEQELKWYIKEVKRLKNIQEECIYLREKFIEHYQRCLES